MANRKHMQRAALLVPALVLACALRAEAQASVKIGDHEVDIHGFMQQGFVSSTGNNFLTMGSNDGSVKMTDGGINASTKLTEKLRVGTQLYVRSIGQFGAGHLELDWAFADYHVNDWIGFRGGKVKTQLGLINDTQDMEFLHTWALLPQSVYPLDLRSVTIAHSGADVYGTLSSKKAGSLAYTVYGGSFPDDKQGGYRYGIEDLGIAIKSPIKRWGIGTDLRWTTPVEGLQAGFSRLESYGTFDLAVPGVPIVMHDDIRPWRTSSVYGDYQKDKWHFSGEFRRSSFTARSSPALSPATSTTSDGWFLSSAYRVAKPVEVGGYYTRYIANIALSSSEDSNHIAGPVATMRLDLGKYVSVKVEGHFMDGYGSNISPHGFYVRDNLNGFADHTNMLVVRTAFSF